AVAPGVEVPRYGGIYTEAITTSPQGFDPLVVPTNSAPTLQVTHDTLVSGDWTRGPAGTGDTDWLYGMLGRTDLWSGQLAESWEIRDAETIIYHIRKGVRWMSKPPVNGRELTAEDIAWNLESEWKKPGTNFQIFFKAEDRMISAKAIDKYTVEVKNPPKAMGINILENGEREFFRAPEVDKQYGNQNDWRNMNTTGPFYIVDYVPGSLVSYAKNPNYWETDPIGPGKGNQLPYIDGMRQLIIPDASTRLAAFRTGKIDLMRSLSWEDALDLEKRNPNLKSVQLFGAPLIPSGRADKPNLPFKDVRVRRALNMAVNKQEIVDLYYQGRAVLYGYPFYPTAAHSAFFTPFKDLPASAQEMFTYNPEKAKQLLKEAGYPNGFKANIVVSSAGTNVDYIAMIKNYLIKVGVDIQIQPLETSIYNTVSNGKTYDEMIARTSTMSSLPYMLHDARKDSAGNASMWEDEQTLATYQAIQDNLSKNDAAWVKALKDLGPHLLDEAWGIFMPVPYVYHMWWPWVKNFRGELSTGYARSWRHTRYAWIDQELKKSMGY
ncbi:MAG: ABC transporter substrate-binding protein, partial [Chloroflexota bacterium]